jgi:serine peptidase DegS
MINVLGFVVRAVIAGLALAFLLVYLWPSLAARLAHDDKSLSTPSAPAPISYADAVNRTAPAVVSIETRSSQLLAVDAETQQRLGGRNLFHLRRSDASGVLMSEDGFILTNHHVISQAQNIRAVLWDGREAPVQVVGSDPATDLAVLKVNLTGLPSAPLAEDPEVQVGDVVLAIGNALGLSHTVTMGIVSATGRNDLKSSLYEDFIQTDAAINSGNSGGALINAQGELIGINSRNLESIEGVQNIGFAIPISLALNVMNQIIDYGSVRRGWLGASFSDIRPTARSDGSKIRRGIGVRNISKGGPAWDAGIRRGDIILALDGEPVIDASQFDLAISQREPGSQVELDVERRTESFQTYATLIQQPPL